MESDTSFKITVFLCAKMRLQMFKLMMSLYYLHLEYFIRTKYSKRGIIKLKSLELLCRILAQGKMVITIIKRERYKKKSFTIPQSYL